MTTTTKLDWGSMTDTEKCAAVAKADGWLDVVEIIPGKVIGRPSTSVPSTDVPDYLRDPRAWWPLVEAFSDFDFADVRRTVLCADGSKKVWLCTLGGVDGDEDVEEGYGITPGEAVCIAFLRSKGIEVTTT